MGSGKKKDKRSLKWELRGEVIKLRKRLKRIG
jgi:hypothetical protein